MNNPTISHDYTEMIAELKSEIAEGLTSLRDSLNIVRGKADASGYCPVEDYYPLNAEESLETPAEIKQYKKDKPKFEQITAEELLEELERKSELISPLDILASNIRAARLDVGLTQAQLASKIDVGHRTYQRWEAGEREPSIMALIKIADATGVSVSYLLIDVNP